MSEEKDKVEGDIPIEDVKQQIRNGFSTVLEEEGEGQQYDHQKASVWIQRMCDDVMGRLIKLQKPYKFIVQAMVMRKTGAGMHVCSSAYYQQNDNCVCESHDVSKFLYCVITVYWVSI